MNVFYLGVTLFCLLLCSLALVSAVRALAETFCRLRGAQPFLQAYVFSPLQRQVDQHRRTQRTGGDV